MKRSVRRLMLNPASCCVKCSGPLIAHATKEIAMPFIMIVVTTSWAPVFTLRTAGTDAKATAPSIPNAIVTHMSNGPGRKSSFNAAQAAATMPTRYWPSTPMLNMPPLKQTATARAEKMRGVAIEITYPKPSLLPNENVRIAP